MGGAARCNADGLTLETLEDWSALNNNVDDTVCRALDESKGKRGIIPKD